MKTKKKRVLIAPLDWGLGHASRCIPIIDCLLENEVEVVLAADRQPLLLLKEVFPTLEFVRLKGMHVKYPKKIPMSLFMAMQAPKFFETISFENRLLQDIVKNYKIEGVISDNRYGLFHSEVPSVLITHQLFIQAPFLKTVLKKITEKYANNFESCWVPDFETSPNLSGLLSHQHSSLNNIEYIGPLSRFSKLKNEHSNSLTERELMVILSGPEPSRTEFEKRLIPQLEKLNKEVLLIRGLIGKGEHTEVIEKGNVKMLNHLSVRKMYDEIQRSKLILSRSGYSTLMDLVAIGKKALLVPTPGQTEQEYLAQHLNENNWFYCVEENKLDLEMHIDLALNQIEFPLKVNELNLQKAVTNFLEKLS